MEACGGSHFLGRRLRDQGHDVRLMPAQYVKPYVKTNKNDYIDAEAIAEAVGRPRMRFVPIKSDDQLDMQSLHRVRDRWVAHRTAVINQIRGLLLERGITFRKGRRHAEASLPGVLEDPDNGLSGPLRTVLAQLQGECRQLQSQIDEADALIAKAAGEHEACRRLMAIPGIGPVTATAVVASIGNGAEFKKARAFATWLGLVPVAEARGLLVSALQHRAGSMDEESSQVLVAALADPEQSSNVYVFNVVNGVPTPAPGSRLPLPNQYGNGLAVKPLS